ncbi:hypothetical protein L7F22_045205 [Adiantum nelumboides]|nr:hypothetical protein [Adiantum nelumboides]
MSQGLSTPVEPSSVKEALQHDCWKRAMHTELDAIERNKTWTLVPRPKQQKIVSTKWILRTKYKADGSLDKHKARLVARGFTQRPGVDFDETYAPTARLTMIRTIFSLAASFEWTIFQMDVKNASLNDDLDIEVYVKQPPSFKVPGMKVKETWFGMTDLGLLHYFLGFKIFQRQDCHDCDYVLLLHLVLDGDMTEQPRNTHTPERLRLYIQRLCLYIKGRVSKANSHTPSTNSHDSLSNVAALRPEDVSIHLKSCLFMKGRVSLP